MPNSAGNSTKPRIAASFPSPSHMPKHVHCHTSKLVLAKLFVSFPLSPCPCLVILLKAAPRSAANITLTQYKLDVTHMSSTTINEYSARMLRHSTLRDGFKERNVTKRWKSILLHLVLGPEHVLARISLSWYTSSSPN